MGRDVAEKISFYNENGESFPYQHLQTLFRHALNPVITLCIVLYDIMKKKNNMAPGLMKLKLLAVWRASSLNFSTLILESLISTVMQDPYKYSKQK